jgi:hypothetical protein
MSMALLDAFLDRYTLLARQRPALLMLFPLLVAAVVIFPALQSWWATLLAVTGTCGVAVALSEFAQAKGKATEPGLLQLWDGLPSVGMLRYRDTRLDPTTKVRYKAFLEEHVPDLHFPDEASERKSPTDADTAYQSSTRWLLAQTRDKKTFALLFQQNISYGFRRNCYGLRWYGLGSCIVALLALIAAASYNMTSQAKVDGEIFVAGFVSAGAFWFWLSAVRPSWVKIAANAYASELLAACDKLKPAKGARKDTA